MSKAFTKDDEGATELLVVPRAPLPTGLPNYVTARGLRLLRAEQRSLEQQRVALESTESADRAATLNQLLQRLSALQARIASAELVTPSAAAPEQVRFGVAVRVRADSGQEHEYRIVGVDEANAGLGLIAFSAPLARALLGKRVGDSVLVQTPRAHGELEVVAIRHPEDI